METALSLGLACMMVFIITLLLMADLFTSLIVLLMVGLTDVAIIGFLHFTGEFLNSLTVVFLVLAVGISVDYNVHLAHAFKTATGTRDERVRKALSSVGVSILHGAFSTFLAIVILAGSETFMFRVFFKSFFGIILFGSIHALILLPVILSWIGMPSSTVEEEKPKEYELVHSEENASNPNKESEEAEPETLGNQLGKD